MFHQRWSWLIILFLFESSELPAAARPLPEIHGKCPNLCVLPGEKALLESTVHGEWDEDQQPPVFEQTERGKESLAEGLPVSSETMCLLLVNVVQEHSYNDHGQHPNSCGGAEGDSVCNDITVTIEQDFH